MTYHLWPLLLTWINFDPEWISNYIHYNVWDEITYPFLNFNGQTIDVRNGQVISSTLYQACDYLSMLGLKLNHVVKEASDRNEHWSSMVITSEILICLVVQNPIKMGLILITLIWSKVIMPLLSVIEDNVCTRVANCLCTHKITLEWVHRQFAMAAHTLFYSLHDIISLYMTIKRPSSYINYISC